MICFGDFKERGGAARGGTRKFGAYSACFVILYLGAGVCLASAAGKDTYLKNRALKDPTLNSQITTSTPTNTPAVDVVDALLDQAQVKQLRGDTNAALALATKAVGLEPTNAQCYYVRGRLYAARRESFQALADFNRALELEPRGGEIYQLRGLEKFRLGQYQESIADFDRFLRFVPKQEPYHWHRGVAYYLVGRYEEGRKQFEMRQKLGTNTVENAFWHFLCSARLEGLEKARASMLPFQDETPTLAMRKLYDCFAGKAKPEDVLAAAQANYASTTQLHRQLFFAHFYLGFLCELTGDIDSAAMYASKAASGELRPNNFMGEVSAAHAEALSKKTAMKR